MTTLRVITYQTEFIGIRALAHVVGQVPFGHPRVHEGEGKKVGAEPQKTNYIWMLQTLPNDRFGAQSL